MPKKSSKKKKLELVVGIKDLTQEEIELSQIYAWIHRRAEFLRKQKAASQIGYSNSSEQPTNSITDKNP